MDEHEHCGLENMILYPGEYERIEGPEMQLSRFWHKYTNRVRLLCAVLRKSNVTAGNIVREI